MLRKIIKINDERCNGCGLCVSACHEGAIGLVDGRARLLRDDYCDGLGDCLPVCPTGAISFESREAAVYDEAAVKRNTEEKKRATGGCPGANLKSLRENLTATDSAGIDGIRKNEALPCGCPGTNSMTLRNAEAQPAALSKTESRLSQWPVQIKLVPINAPYLNNANLLISADCAAYAFGGFHDEFMQNRITLIGCPKLDEGNYADKLTAIFKANSIMSVTVVRMEVPCCGGIENAVKAAIEASGRLIPIQIVTLSTDGKILRK